MQRASETCGASPVRAWCACDTHVVVAVAVAGVLVCPLAWCVWRCARPHVHCCGVQGVPVKAHLRLHRRPHGGLLGGCVARHGTPCHFSARCRSAPRCGSECCVRCAVSCVVRVCGGAGPGPACTVLQRDFTAKFGDMSLQCQPDELTNRAKVLLKDLCDRLVPPPRTCVRKVGVRGVAGVGQVPAQCPAAQVSWGGWVDGAPGGGLV